MTIEPAPRGSKTIYIEKLGVWYDESQRQIHLSIPGHETFHTTVSDNPASKRYHANLYKKLKALLVEANRWPTGG